MNVLVADKLSEKGISALRDSGCNLEVRPELTTDTLASALDGVEVLVVRSTRVQKEQIRAAKALSLIIRAGAGVNTIDLEEAGKHGIHVSNCPGKNKDAVAELTAGLIIASDRRIVDASLDMRKGEWGKKKYAGAGGLKGRTLGVIGFGSIARAVIKRFKAFEMKIAVWSRSFSQEKADESGLVYCKTLNDIALISDVVSVHIASVPETKHLINSDFFSRMKDAAIFVNTSRGEVVDTGALKKAIPRKGLRVGLDVYENEPSGSNREFCDTELSHLVTATPHIGASTEQSSTAIAMQVVEIIKEYMETGKPPYAVNIQRKSPAVTSLIVRHYNKVGVLAFVLDKLRKEEINIEEMENTIFKGCKAASCTMKLDNTPSKDFLPGILENRYIIQAVLK